MNNRLHQEPNRGPLHGFASALLCLTALVIGCGTDAALSDNIELEIQGFELGQPDNTLHSPYVRGAEFKVSGFGEDVPDDAQIVSEDKEILRPTSDTRSLTRSFKAEGAGRSAFRVLDGRDSLRRGGVIVMTANDAKLHFHGDVLLGTATTETEIESPKILVGGTATFLVNYYRGKRRLHGHGVLTVEPEEGSAWSDTILDRSWHWGVNSGFSGENDALRVRVKETFFSADRDWLQISPKQPGEHTIQLFADGAPIGEVTIQAVTEDDVEAILVRKRSEEDLSEGDAGLALAEAFDLNGERIYGLEYAWDIDGQQQDDEGDLFKYFFDATNPGTLCAVFEEHESITQIHASRGYVGSTNDVAMSCEASGGVHNTISLISLLLFGGLIRRRRVQTGGSSSPHSPEHKAQGHTSNR